MQICEQDHVLEIGTGLGALTKILLGQGAQVLSYEIDKGVYRAVSGLLAQEKRLVLKHQDFLKADWNEITDWSENGKIRVMANLPYSITSSILLILWHRANQLQDMVVMVQKEVGERIQSVFNTKQFGLLSVILQTSFKVQTVRNVPKECFFPAPSVDSIFLKFIPLEQDLLAQEKPLFLEMVKWCFLNRRKQLLSRIRQRFSGRLVSDELETMLGKKRPENLSLPEWKVLFSFWTNGNISNKSTDMNKSKYG